MAEGSLKGRKAATAIAALGLAALAACTSTAPEPPAAPPPVVTAPPPPAPTPPPRPAPPPQPADTCGAQPLQYLVGKPRTQIPAPVYPNRRRVICLGCPASSDVLSWRQTIVYDLATGRVRSVYCG